MIKFISQKRNGRRKLCDVISGGNFSNILPQSFLYESKLGSFSLITFSFLSFCPKNIGAKGACKMLMTLTPGGSAMIELQ